MKVSISSQTQHLILFVTAISFLVVSTALSEFAIAQEKTKSDKPTSFQLYYGGEESLLASLSANIKPAEIVVVDVRSITAHQFGRLKRKTNESGAKLLAYISIGELHSREMEQFESFLGIQNAQDLEKLNSRIFIGENKVFSSYHVDVSQPEWRSFIIDKAKDILATGVDGLFLDTVDTADVYIRNKDWDLDRRAKSVTAMISLIREFKAQPQAPSIMQNRGLNLIGKEIFVGDAKGIMIPGLNLAEAHQHNPNAILYEDAFSSTGEWGSEIIRKLDAIQKSGEVTVVALGYAAVIKDKEPFLQQCKKHGFVPSWSKDSQSLHLEIAR